jgi:transglutaminase/protease-like cytokinesis protein 3
MECLLLTFSYGSPFLIQEYAIDPNHTTSPAASLSAENDRTLAQRGNRQSLESAAEENASERERKQSGKAAVSPFWHANLVRIVIEACTMTKP